MCVSNLSPFLCTFNPSSAKWTGFFVSDPVLQAANMEHVLTFQYPESREIKKFDIEICLIWWIGGF